MAYTQPNARAYPLHQTYYFARDNRVYKAFIDRIDKHRRAIERTASRRLKWQIRVLAKVLDGRNTTYRVCKDFIKLPVAVTTHFGQSKVETLAGEFDQGEGV